MLEAIPGIRRLTIPQGGGLDETSPVTDVAIEDFIELEDFRLSRDGKRLQKRYGIGLDSSSHGGDVYGIATYVDSDAAFCELVVTSATIRRSVGGASYTTVHTFSSAVSHPVDVLEIQGKQFIINEVDSRMIHTDKADYQIGIDKPTTLPTLTGGYDSAILEEACAALGSWADNDTGAGASTQVTYDSKSTFRFLNTGGAGDMANRSLYPITDRMPNKFVFETSIYQNTLGSMTATSADDSFFIVVSTGYGRIGLGFDKKELWVINGSSWPTDLLRTGIINKLDQWVDIKFVYDGSDPDARFCEIYMDDEYQGKWYITDTSASLEGHVGLILYGVNVATDVYVDYINISDAESAKLNGQYRYAVTYARGGNFGCESNPIKSLVGTPALTGTGIDDLSAGGIYTGGKDRTFRVEIDGTGTPDTVKVSYDGGNTWHTTTLNLPALSLTELVTNGGFGAVEGTTGWTAANGAVLTSPAGGQSGNCLLITGNASNNPFAYQAITVNPNTHYHLSFYEKNGTETEYRARIYDATNEAYLTGETWLAGDAAWTQGHVAFYTPSNCKSIWIVLQSRSQSGEGKTFYFDTVTLYEAYVMYLNFGVTLGWGYSTGHTSGDYWDIACDALAIGATNQKVTFASIPVSTDAQVDQRKIYRTLADGANYYWLTTINDNTTTAFVDNVPDTGLGLSMEDDKDTFGELPSGTGKFSEWWDDRLWVTGDNIVYYSEIEYPEEFDEANRKINIRTGDQQDEITGMKEYGDNLYVFKRNSVFIIQKKAGLAYGRYKTMDGIGCMAGWSIVKVNNLMMWLSDKGVELFNGTDVYSHDFSVKILRTLDDIERNKLDYITSGHFRKFNEVLWSLPDRGSSVSVFIAYNTIKNKFYRFSQRVDISCISEVEDSGGVLRLAVGSRNDQFGYLNPSTQVYQDWGSGTLTATARKGWINLGKGSHLHGIEIEFESVTSKDLTLNVYLDMDKDVFYTATLSGKTPSATDRELRRPIKHFAPFGGRETRYVNYELINADATAGDSKINRVDIFFVPKIIKKTQEPD